MVRFSEKTVVWVKTSSLLRLEDLCCHGYNNKNVVEVMEQSQLKETMLTIGNNRK